MSENDGIQKQERVQQEEVGQERDEKRVRRTRSDDDGRKFNCSCGKSYLSYPALYTHIKNKHNGQVDFTNNSINSIKKQVSSYEAKQYEIQQNERCNQNSSMQLLKKYLSRLFPMSKKERDGDNKMEGISQQNQDYLSSIKQHWEKRIMKDEPQSNQTYATPIDFVMGKFLVNIQKEVSKLCQHFLCDFVINLRDALNSLQKNNTFCTTSNATDLPLMMNSVLDQCFKNNQEGHLYRRHPTILCKMLLHFSRWLFEQKFSNQSLRLNTEGEC